jgi:predicted nucleotidyltransferase
MKVRTAQELMRDNMLVKHRAGSHAYGTAIATSDLDFRGVFVADPVNVRTPFFPVYEAEDQLEEDTKLFELAHFMKLPTTFFARTGKNCCRQRSLSLPADMLSPS